VRLTINGLTAASDILFLKIPIRAINNARGVQRPGKRQVRSRGRAGNFRRQGRQGEKKANSGSFDGKSLISFKTSKEKAWKSLQKAWKKLGKVCKKL